MDIVSMHLAGLMIALALCAGNTIVLRAAEEAHFDVFLLVKARYEK